MKPSAHNAGIVIPVVTLLGVHAGLVAWLGAHQSPNVDEPAHLAAGMAMWQYGSFEVYCVNPPLMRAVATLPILLMPHEELWADFDGAPQPRPEFILGAQFVESHPARWRRFLIAARWAILPFCVVGGLLCFLWAAELFGRKAGLIALTLWCFSPNVLAWSPVICTDGVAAAMGIGAGYSFWRWIKRPTWGRASVAGVFLGLAQLSKMTWIVLFALWPVLWALARWRDSRREAGPPRVVQLIAILIVGIYLVNFGYGFDGTFTRLGDYDFTSHLLTGDNSEATDGPGGNRFAGSVLQWLPVPLPQFYVLGLDLQKANFEEGMPSYLFGEWSDRGWWYYYLVGLGLKVPLGTWLLGVLATVCWLHPTRKSARAHAVAPSPTDNLSVAAFDQMIVLAPAITVLVLVSSHDGLSRHFRYVLPAFPFMFVWMSQVANQASRDRFVLSGLVLLSLGWSLVSSLAVYPHTISYFNEAAGGPGDGHQYMLHSSHSWSQDQFYLKEWINAHSQVDSPYLLLDRPVPLERLGIMSRGRPPKSSSSDAGDGEHPMHTLGPVPGWHAISIQHIHDRDGGYRYFLDFEPYAKIGHSIYVYHISLDHANRVRGRLGLPEISQQHLSPDELLADMRDSKDSNQHLSVAMFDPRTADIPSNSGIREVLENDPNLSLTRISSVEICAGVLLKEYDVLVVPGGRASEQGAALGAEGRESIRTFVDEGGGYIGVCAGAHLATTNHEWSLKLINARSMAGTRYVPRYGMVSASFRGRGNVAIELTGEGNRLFDGLPPRFTLSFTGGPVFCRANMHDLPDYQCLARFGSEISKYPFQRGTMVHTPAIVCTQFGEGKVVLFSPHPESTSQYEHLLTQCVRACASPGRPCMAVRDDVYRTGGGDSS